MKLVACKGVVAALESSSYRDAQDTLAKNMQSARETEGFLTQQFNGKGRKRQTPLHWEGASLPLGMLGNQDDMAPLLVGGGRGAASARTAPYTACGRKEEDSRPRQR